MVCFSSLIMLHYLLSNIRHKGVEKVLKLSERSGSINVLANILALIMCLFQLYTAFFGTFEAFYQRSIHVALAVILVILIKPLKNRQFQLLDALYIIT